MHDQVLNREASPIARRFGAVGAFFASKGFARGAIIALGTLLCLSIYLMTVTPKRYTLTVGMVPNQTIVAHKDVVDEVTTAENRIAAAQAVTPIYHYRDGVAEQVSSQLSDVYAQMVAVRQYARQLPDFGSNRAYSPEEYEGARGILTLVPLKDFQFNTLMNAGDEQFEQMFADLAPAVRNAMQGNVTQGQESLAINGIMQVAGFKTGVSLLQNVVLPTLRTIIRPNMVIDDEATDTARQQARDAVEPVVYKQGQNIVVRGEGRVRENQLEMLASLGLLSENRVDYAMYAGSAVFVIAILTLMAVSLRVFSPAVFFNNRRLPIIYLAGIVTLLLTHYAKELQLVYLAPLILPYMLLSVCLSVAPAVTAGAAMSMIGALMLINTGGTNTDMVNLLVMSLFSGVLTAQMLARRYQRSFLLFAGTVASLSNFLIILAVGMMTSLSLSQTVVKALWALGGGAVGTLLCIAMQPVLESAFNLPTPMRLLDLTNPHHPLLRRLLLEAPGTYHHSIIIANLAETAAEAIGANPLLARAGAYFHDIGKLKRPLYFKENQIGTSNLHDKTDPQVSAAIIISHVREGLALAREHRLPEEIQQIIAEHHGNSLVQYFYHKAQGENKPGRADERDFRYDGEPPRTAEGAIIMLCDTVEAAIRTITNPSREEISSFIADLIRQKAEAGLLDAAPLTLRDLKAIGDACVKVIYGVFHERVEYPKAPEKPAERLLAHLQQFRKPAHAAETPHPPSDADGARNQPPAKDSRTA